MYKFRVSLVNHVWSNMKAEEAEPRGLGAGAYFACTVLIVFAVVFAAHLTLHQ